MIAVKPEPVAMMDGSELPIAMSSRGASTNPAIPIGTATADAERDRRNGRRRRPSGSFSPMRRATVAAAPIESPIATA